MPITNVNGRSARGGSNNRASAITSSGSTTTVNAIELLESDHRQVESWFEDFQSTDDSQRRRELASAICKALQVHAQIEEEIFYPAFLEATDDQELHHEAVVEHEGAKALIAKILESAGPSEDDYFEARVKVLAELIKHHVNEEEKAGGMFDEARKSAMDLEALGADLEQRKLELMEDANTDAGYDAAVAAENEEEEDDDDDDDEDEDEDEDDDEDDDDDDDDDEDEDEDEDDEEDAKPS